MGQRAEAIPLSGSFLHLNSFCFSSVGYDMPGSVLMVWLPLKLSPKNNGTVPARWLGMYMSMLKYFLLSFVR